MMVSPGEHPDGSQISDNGTQRPELEGIGQPKEGHLPRVARGNRLTGTAPGGVNGADGNADTLAGRMEGRTARTANQALAMMADGNPEATRAAIARIITMRDGGVGGGEGESLQTRCFH